MIANHSNPPRCSEPSNEIGSDISGASTTVAISWKMRQWLFWVQDARNFRDATGLCGVAYRPHATHAARFHPLSFGRSSRLATVARRPPAGERFQEHYMSINKDQVKGRVLKSKGSVKQAVGRVTGDARLEASGRTQKTLGTLRAKYGDAKRR